MLLRNPAAKQEVEQLRHVAQNWAVCAHMFRAIQKAN